MGMGVFGPAGQNQGVILIRPDQFAKTELKKNYSDENGSGPQQNRIS